MKMARTAHDKLNDSPDRICFENNDDDDVVKDTKALVSELCRNFYTLGWVSGTGGSVSIKVLHQENVLNKSHQLIVMSPSGVQKERMVPEDMFVLCSDGSVSFRPLPKPYPHHNPPKCTDCAVLFLKGLNSSSALNNNPRDPGRFILLDMMTATVYSSSIHLKHAPLYKDAESVDMVGHIVSDDVPQALKKWHSSGIKVYIYSSHHSRVAQSQFFGKSTYGDLRKFLCGYFDTTMGFKTKVTTSEISETVGVEKPSDMLFVTETLHEALAARAAGMEVVIWIRPGTEPSVHKYLGIRTIKSLLELS